MAVQGEMAFEFAAARPAPPKPRPAPPPYHKKIPKDRSPVVAGLPPKPREPSPGLGALKRRHKLAFIGLFIAFGAMSAMDGKETLCGAYSYLEQVRQVRLDKEAYHSMRKSRIRDGRYVGGWETAGRLRRCVAANKLP